MVPMNIALLNVVLPYVIALYKEIRDANPSDPMLTDAAIIAMLGKSSAQVVADGQAWLAAHPPTP